MATNDSGVPEDVKLNGNNYAKWRDYAKNYLRANNLWDCIIGGFGEAEYRDQEWKKKNEHALQFIRESCKPKFLPMIKHCDSAMIAWLTLKQSCWSSAEADIEKGLTPLQRIVRNNDLESARFWMIRNPKAIWDTSEEGKTVVHVAVEMKNETMVKMLAKQVPKRLLEERDAYGYTALARVADLTDDIAMAKFMVNRSEALLGIQNNEGFIPVVVAAIRGHKSMTSYLFGKTPQSFLNEIAISGFLLTRCLTGEIFDVALELLQRNPQLPLNQKFDSVSPIYALAQKPSVFPSGSPPTFWQRWLYNCLTHDHKGNAIEIRSRVYQGNRRRYIRGHGYNLWGKLTTLKHLRRLWEKILGFLYKKKILGFYGIKRVYDKKMTHFQVVEILCCMAKEILNYDDSEQQEASVSDSLLEASKNGIVEFITLMTEANPRLYQVKDSKQRGIFSYAVLNRQERIFNLVHKLEGRDRAIIWETDISKNNLLHFTGMSEALYELDHRSGPALLMQRELQWFEAVKGILHPKFQLATNTRKQKPQELFTKQHKQLVKDGVQWAKNTANTFTVVATLLITIMFAAAFTVPGGNNDDGIPIFLNERMFTVFMVADALSLFASTTSVMIFISILTSRYAEKDFLKSLPMNLMFGLLALVCAVLTMMLAFCAAFYLMLRGHFQIVIFAFSGASASVIIFLMLQLPLLFEIGKSTCRPPFLVNKNMT